MANIKITELNETLTKTNNDVLPIVDITANETKKIKIENLLDKNIELLAVSDTAPSECNTGDKYYNTSTKLVYTATAQDTWSDTGTTPISGILYIVYNDQASYSWDGTDLVSVGGGKEDIVIDDTEPTDPDVKLWIDTGEIENAGSELIDSYEETTRKGYTARYVNHINHYSTIPKMIGYWKDDKPIYRVVYEISYPSGSTTKSESTGITNLGEIVKIDSIVKKIYNNYYDYENGNYGTDSAYARVFYRTQNNTIEIRTSATSTNNIYYVTLEYTEAD